MTRIKYTSQNVQTIAFFEQLTHANLRDSIDDEQSGMLYFVVEPGEMGKAIGKNASNLRTLEEKLNRKIKIVEFDPEVLKFIANLSYPVRPSGMKESGGTVIITPPDLNSRGVLIGRGGSNLRAMERVAKRYFKITEIKVA